MLEPLALPVKRGSSELSRTLGEWDRLTHGGAPFVSPAFQLLTLRLLLPRREAMFFGAVHDGKLAVALPLLRHGRVLRAVRADHTPRVDVAGHDAALPALWQAIREQPGWDVLELGSVPAGSPLATRLLELARADGCAVEVRETGRAPHFAIAGIEERIHRRFRGDMRRLERQLGGVELERVATFDHGALEDALRLEAAAWKGAAGTAIACDPRLVRFYSALARVFARRGQLTIAFLRARGRRIAAQIALEDASTLYLLKTGYDPEYARFGPGQILVREVAADAHRRGLVRYDLMGQDTPWKMKWTDEVTQHVQVAVYAPSVGGRVRHFVREVARPLAGRALRAVRGRRYSPLPPQPPSPTST